MPSLPVRFDEPSRPPPRSLAGSDRPPALAAAVAAVVAIAAERALARGELSALRASIDRVLDAAEPKAGMGGADDRPPPSVGSDRDRQAALLMRRRG